MKIGLGLLLLLLSLPACSMTLPVPPTGTATIAPADSGSIPASTAAASDAVSLGFHLLVTLEGMVEIKREGWSGYHSAGFGTVLQPGDLILPEKEAVVQLLCDDLSLRTVTAGVPSGIKVVCPRLETPINRAGVSVINTRDGNNGRLPYIIRPRATKLLSQTPLLKWNDTGAASYTVRINGDGLEWQQPDIAATELVYPGDPPLEPGVRYTITVEDSNNQVSANHPGLAFKTLDEAGRDEVEILVEAVNRVDNLSQPARALALFQVYHKRELFAEATDLVQSLIDQGSQPAAVYQALGDGYSQVGLAQMAEQPYLTALELAKQQKNMELVMAAQLSLGQVYTSLGHVNLAAEYLEAARAGYDALGAADQVAQIDQYLDELK